MKRSHCATTDVVLPMECWGEILLSMRDATSVLNLSVVSHSFYAGLEPFVLKWLVRNEIKSLLTIGNVHDTLYMCHLSNLYREWRKKYKDCVRCESASGYNMVKYCWYVDTVKKSITPLSEMNLIYIELNNNNIMIARNLMKEASLLLREYTIEWCNAACQLLAKENYGLPCQPEHRLHELLFDGQMISSFENYVYLFPQIGMTRLEMQQIVRRTFCANQCYDKSHSYFAALAK